MSTDNVGGESAAMGGEKATKPWIVADPIGEVVIAEPTLDKLGLRVIDKLITEMIRDEKPNTARFQRIQTLCSIGAHLNQIYAVSVEEAQPVEEELGGLGYAGMGGLGMPMPMPVGMPRARNVGRFVGGDTAELIRMLLAAIEQLKPLNPQQRDITAAVAATTFAEARAEDAVGRAHEAMDDATDALVNARAAVHDAEAAVVLAANPLG